MYPPRTLVKEVLGKPQGERRCAVLEDPVRAEFQAMAEGRGVSVSDHLRSPIDGLFDRTDRAEPRRRVVPESLTSVDRGQPAPLPPR